MTTEEEVRAYCERRQIVRPHINYVIALLLLSLYEISVEVSSHFLYAWGSDAFSFLNGKEAACYWGTQLLFFLIFGRWIAVFAVRLYQRFAPEHVRRRCHCRPSCSEYAVIVLRRYGIIWGGYKCYRRIFYTCGAGYVDDAP